MMMKILTSPRFVSMVLVIASCALASSSAHNYYEHSSWYTTGGNLALYKHSYQSTTRYSGDAPLGNDGGFSRRYWDRTCTHTNNVAEANSWWTVDLGESKDVKIVHFTPRDEYLERYQSLEVRVGDVKVDGNGDNNTVCDAIETAHDGKVKTIFRCGSPGRYVTLRLSDANVPLTVCEVMVFDFDKTAETILKPHLLDNGDCPEPLQETCESNKAQGMSPEDAAIKAFMEGPIDCGSVGFFCRMKEDSAGLGGGMTGTPGDQLVNNRNYGYCEDRDDDRRINWNSLSRQPRNDDGHCHGSEFDSSYIGVLQDHYYRPYRGTIHCCCGLEKRDDEGDWAPAKNYISRCDYRGEDANDANQNFERGCGLNMLDFIGKDDFPNPEKCWTLDHFGEPYEKVVEMPPYEQPKLRVTACQDSGCIVDLTSRWSKDTRLLMSTYPLEEPRMIDDIASCDEIHGVEISEKELVLKDWKDLSNVPSDNEGLPVQIGVAYQGCYKDNRKRAFSKSVGRLTMEECAYAALAEGSPVFAMQYPQGSSGEAAKCFIHDKGVRTDDPDAKYGKRPDSECKGEDFNPTFQGEEFEFNGSGWRNAVYDITATDANGAQVEISFDYTLLDGLEPGTTTYVQVIDMYTCALSDVVSLTTTGAAN